MPLYQPQEARHLEPWFSRHMNAMTAEGLHSKSEIAEQLAARDLAIDHLVASLGALLGEKQPLGIDRPVYQNALAMHLKYEDRDATC